MNYIKDKRDRKIRQYISNFGGSNSDTEDAGKENQETFNFYFNIKPYFSYYNNSKAEAFWTKFAKEQGQRLWIYLSFFLFVNVASVCISRSCK